MKRSFDRTIQLDIISISTCKSVSFIQARCSVIALKQKWDRQIRLFSRFNHSVLLQKNTMCVDDINYYHRVTVWSSIFPLFLTRFFRASSEILVRTSISKCMNYSNQNYIYTHNARTTIIEVVVDWNSIF